MALARQKAWFRASSRIYAQPMTVRLRFFRHSACAIGGFL
jgi:hypothetical protein